MSTDNENWWDAMSDMDESSYEDRRQKEAQLPPLEHARMVAQRNQSLLQFLEIHALQLAMQAREAFKDEQAVLDRLSEA